MKFFKRKEKNYESNEDELYDELLNSPINDKPQIDKITLETELGRIRKQIDEAQEEHEAILGKLMPAKWELLDKKEQLRLVKAEYEEISSKLSKAKTELDKIMRKLDKLESDDNYNAT